MCKNDSVHSNITHINAWTCVHYNVQKHRYTKFWYPDNSKIAHSECKGKFESKSFCLKIEMATLFSF